MSTKMDKNKQGVYIDLFSGCGGLSLGLGNAGWKGLFAVEKDSMAFNTFKHNLIDGKHSHFEWPSFLPKKETTIQELLEKYPQELTSLRGKVDLIAGGPPCQGFSLAGQRNEKDPRNKLSEEYIKMVELVSPKYILLENVRGFASSFKSATGKKAKLPYAMVVKKKLEDLGYAIFHDFLCSADFGVPQKRTRFIMIGIKKEHFKNESQNPFDQLLTMRSDFLKSKGLPDTKIRVKDAINDLLIENNQLDYHSGNQKSGFKKLKYISQTKPNAYLKLMRNGMGKKSPNSLRIARHRPETIIKFKLIQKICKPGITLSNEMRAQIGTRKQAITVLNPEQPSKTLTTLPDDLLHYSEPRILTVREMARIQSFPDWFDILGKYTTGGNRRTQECPRYTQVGNAVPPLVGEIIGLTLKGINKIK